MVTANLSRSSGRAPLQVISPARLHLGLVNESGYLDRVDGGLGVQVRFPRWEYRLSPANYLGVIGDVAAELEQNALSVLRRCCARFGIDGAELTILEGIPLHAGLGAKTSFLASIVKAIASWTDHKPSIDCVARLSGRGGTSGVGINAIHTGGFIIDVGRRFGTEKDAFLPSSRHNDRAPRTLPPFRLRGYSIVHFRFGDSGISGAQEADFFAQSCPIPVEETKELLLQLYGRLLPALLEDDDAELQASLRTLQNVGLKRREWEIQSEVSRRFRGFFESAGLNEALCLSSVGPTVAVITRRPSEVLEVIGQFESRPVHLEKTCVSQEGMIMNSLPQGDEPNGVVNSHPTSNS